jgi:DegV family protein with EDD domain
MEEINIMKIGVLTDSSSYLTKEQCEKYGIDVLPIPIIWDNKEYLDLIDIGFHEFYKKLNSSTTLPTTSQPSIGTVKRYVEKYINEGYTDLIIITLSSGISSFYSNVLSVANEETRINIHPFDCKITCAGEADAAILAGRLVKAGADINLIMHDLKDLRNTTDVRFMVDNLNHLKRTGRLSNAASFVGSILKIKPILSMDVQNEGKISAIAKERQYKRAYNHIKKDFSRLTSNMPYPIQLTIFHADDEERETAWINDYQTSFPKIKVDQSIIGPVVGVHVGQHTMAMIWCRDLDSYFDKNGKPLLNINSQVVED